MVDKKTFRQVELGRTHFNARRWFEAHEAWEEAWLVRRGPARHLLQGLIQIAAGFYKAEQQKAGPCAWLLEAGLEKIADAAAADPVIAAFAEIVRGSLAEARRWELGQAAGIEQFPLLPPFGGENTPAG